MRIAYVTHTRFPTEKAHGHQIARVGEALVALGHDVTLVAPGVRNTIRQNFVKYYHLKREYPLKHIHTFDALQSRVIPGRFAFFFTMHSYRGSLREYFADHTFDLLYARSPLIEGALLKTNIPVVLELHALPKRSRSRFVGLCNRCTRVVCLTSVMRDELVKWGVPKSKVIVEGDAVDPERFKNLPSASHAKHHYDLPDDRPIVGYVGSLVTMDKVQKGVDLLIDALIRIKKHDHKPYLFVVGGPDHWVEKYRKRALHAGYTDHDFTFHGSVQSKLVPDAISACDICVYPAPDSKHPYFMRDTSPLKLFEYAAVGKPIVCADLPPIRDVFSKEMVRFFHPGSESSLAGALRDVIENPVKAKKMARKAKEAVANHTWEKRMGRIMDGLPSPK